MKSSSRLLDRRLGYSLASLGMLLGVVAPAALPAFASAGTLTTRSITMSTSAADATGADYTVTFTPAADFDHVVIDWCDSATGPLIGAECTTPADFNAASVSVSSSDLTGASRNTGASTAGHTVIDTTSSYDSADGALSFELSGIHNSSAVGSFYARMYTYAGSADWTDAENIGTPDDTGSVALATTSNIGVTAYVLESMTFCVSGDKNLTNSATALTANCGALGGGSASGTSDPSMTLGEDTGNGTLALNASALSTSKVLTQLSTNAVGGVTVTLKSDATTCGGLYRNNVKSNCEIGPKTSAGAISAGTAAFGILVGNAGDAASAPTTPSGTITQNGSYSPTDYFMDYQAGDGSGVTSTYGSPIYHSASTVNNKNVDLTFGASISSTTPAGKYGANMSLIATGTF